MNTPSKKKLIWFFVFMIIYLSNNVTVMVITLIINVIAVTLNVNP
ncbi:hypothetical protein H1P_230024 [Hyella patelloides LEGE 07179]|uniref:Uncharacterized protein n=1 Tax=Hyella patelloides LEGE 07179 TaxID=945734 RepID=A0A563VRE8_9CYAN|nr:hypothetical protein H1P_230024 [Hyella patelloides LEGE 07179]